MIGDRVEELRPQPAGKPVLELVDVEPVLVDRNRDDVRLEAAERHDRAEVRRRLDDHDVAAVEERLPDELERLDRAARDHSSSSRRAPALERLDPAGERVERAGEPARRRVLKRAASPPSRELGEQRRRALARKRQRIGKASGERDDVRHAEKREHRRDAVTHISAGSRGEEPLPGLRLRRDGHDRTI